MKGRSSSARLGLVLLLSASTVAARPATGGDLVPLWKSTIPRSVDGDLESATVAVLRELSDGHWAAVTGGPYRRAIRRIAPGGSGFTETSVSDTFVGASAAVDSFGAWVDATDSGIVKRDIHGLPAWSAPVQQAMARGCLGILIDPEGDVFVLWDPGSTPRGRRVSKLDGRTGALLWSSVDLAASQPGFILGDSTMVSGADGDVVAALANEARTRVLIVRLRGTAGQEQWRALEPASMYFRLGAGERSVQVDRAGDVYLTSDATVDSTEPAGLYKLSGTTGGRLWRHPATGISDLTFTTAGRPLAVLCTQTAQVHCTLRELSSGAGALLREMALPDPPSGVHPWRVYANSPTGVAGLLISDASAARVRLVSVDLGSGVVQPAVVVPVPSSRPLVSARFEGRVATLLCASQDPSILLPAEILRADAVSGAVAWRLALPSLGDGTLKGLSAATTAGGTLVISESHLAGYTAQQRTAGLDPASGRILWGPFIDAQSSLTANAGSPVAVAFQDDILLASAVQDTLQLHRRDAVTGQREWGPVTVSGVTPLSLQIVPLGNDFLLLAPYTVSRHAGGSGAEAYRVSPGGVGSQHSIAATPDGTAFYVGWWAAGFAYVTKRDAATGAVLWTAGGPGVFGSWTPYAIHLTEQGDIVAVFLEGGGFMPSWVNLAVLKGSSGTLESLSRYVYSTRALLTRVLPSSGDVLLAGLTAPAPVRRISRSTGAALWNAPVEPALQFLYPTGLRVTSDAVEVLFRGSGGTAVRHYSLETGQIVGSTPVRADLTGASIEAIENVDGDWCLASQRAGVTEVLRLTQRLALDVLDLPGGRCGSPYSKTLAARNPSGAVTFELTAGSLPEGIQLTSAGVLQGTPQGSGKFAFDVKLTSGSQTAAQSLELFLLPSPRRAHLTASSSPAIRGRPVTVGVVETASGHSWQPGGSVQPTTTLTLDEPTDVTLVATDGACGLEGSLRLEVVPDAGGVPAPSTLQAVTPCRVVDTRDPSGVRGGPALPAGQMRAFPLAGTCGVPLTATAVAVNVTAINAAASGFLRVGESASASEGTRAVAFGAGSTRAGFAILGLERNASGNLQVFNDSLGTVDVVLDVSGYFE